MKILLNSDGSGGGGAAPTDWTAGLPDDLKTVVAAKAWKTPADALKSYRELETHIGTKRVAAPQDTWDDKQWNEFYNAIGRPEAADKYEFAKDFKVPDAVDKEKLKAWNERLHKYGITGKQYQRLMQDYLTEEQSAAAAAQKAQEDASMQAAQALKSEWGESYANNVDIAKAVLKKFGDEQTVTHLDSVGPEKVPGLFKFLHKLGSAMLDDRAKGGSGGGINVMDSTSARAEILRLQGDNDYMGKYFSGDKAAVARWNELHERAFPKTG